MPNPSSVEFGKLQLIGLGKDGAYILSLIAKTMKQNFPGNTSWRENIPMVAIGVKEIEALPSNLDPIITLVELEANISWFRGMDPESIPLYLDWWKEAGMPSSGRQMARLAFFNQFIDENSNSLLSQVLIDRSNRKEIQNYYIITSLSDVVGSAIMWDVIHLLERKNSKQNSRSSSVLWLAVKGCSGSSDIAPYAWRELKRLGNGGNINVIRSKFDQKFNESHLKTGLDRIVIVNDSPDALRQIQDAADSSQLLAEIIPLTLAPSFSQVFISDWVPANSKKQDLTLPISTINKVTFFIPADLIKDICILRMIRSLLWGGISRNIPGIFDHMITNLDGTRFSPKAFLSKILQDWNMSPQRTKTGNLNRLLDYKGRFLSIIDEILNGNSAERDNQRKALAGKLSIAISFLDLLLSTIGEGKSAPSIEIGKIAQNFLEELQRWGVEVLGESYSGSKQRSIPLQAVIDGQLQKKRSELMEAMQAKDRHLVLVHPGTDAGQWEDAVYNEWQEYLLSLEKPGLSDPISNLLSGLRWNCTIGEDTFSVRLSVGQNGKSSFDISSEPGELLAVVNQLKELVFVETGKELLSDGLAKRLDELFQPNDIQQTIQKSGNPWTESSGVLNAIHIIGADSEGVALLANRLNAIGQYPKTHYNSAGNPNQISILSIREKIDQFTLFKNTPRTPQKSKFVYSAEMAFSELERESLLIKANSSSSLTEQFTYFLSDPTLARIFGYGLLLGFITYSSKGVFKYLLEEKQSFFFGEGISTGLFYSDHPILAAMEDFVIEMPGKVDNQCHPLHPERRKETTRLVEEMLRNKKNGNAKGIEGRYEKVVEYIRHINTYQPIMNTFQVWLSLIKKNIQGD